MTTKRDRAAAAAFFNDQPQWDLTIAHWIETGEKRYGMGTVRPNVLALADAFAAHAAGEVEEVGIQLVALQARLRLAESTIGALRDISEQDCPYSDNCPVFGSNHGTCEGCKARRALAAWDAVPGDALDEDLDDVPPRC
jgi:hypothetical protein